MLPTGETISPRSKFPDQTASINISRPTSLGCLIGVHTPMAPDPQGFFYYRLNGWDASREAELERVIRERWSRQCDRNTRAHRRFKRNGSREVGCTSKFESCTCFSSHRRQGRMLLGRALHQGAQSEPTNFLVELKRRNVYRAAVAYGVVAWFLTQLTTQVFPFFEIPNSAVKE